MNKMIEIGCTKIHMQVYQIASEIQNMGEIKK